MSKTALYRHFDAFGRLLYVGISGSHLRRLAQHADGASWATDIASVTVDHYPTRAVAVAAERQAIRTERPAHNIAHAVSDARRVAGTVRDMMTASEFADAIGRKTLANTFGVGLTAVSNAVVRGRFPSSWYVASCTLASEAGIQCPPDLFGQKQRDVVASITGITEAH